MKTKLKEIREVQYSFTLKEFSEMLKCSPSYLCEIENGIKFPSMKKLESFSKILGIPVKRLIKS